MSRFTKGCIALAMIVVSANGYADSGMPADVKAKMNGLVGTWEWQQETRNTQESEKMKSSGTWTARWIFDDLIEWRGTSNSAMGSGTDVEYEGYDPMMQGYSYWFSSSGARGRLYDGVWTGDTFRAQQIGYTADGVEWRGRCDFAYNRQFTEVNFRCEALEDGKWWLWREGSATKVKQ